MDKIKQNPFLAAMVGACVLLVILAVVLIYPSWDRKATLEKKVKNVQMSLVAAVNDTPGSPDIQSWNDGPLETDPKKEEKDYWGKLVRSYRNVILFYAEFDWYLEWWMTNGEVRKPEDGAKAEDVARLRAAPSQGPLENAIRDASNQIAARLRGKIPVGLKEEDDASPGPRLGFNWETDLKWDQIRGEEEAVLRTLQKRYWIRSRVANACFEKDKDGKEQPVVQKLVDVYFFRVLHPKLSGSGYRWEDRPTSGSEHELPYAASPFTRGIDRSKFEEYDLPGELGKTITFGVTVDLQYSDVPRFLRRLMDRDLAPRMLVNVVGTRLLVLKQNPAEVEYTYDRKETDDGKNEERRKEAEKKALENVKPQSVRLLVTCQVIDFDSSKVPEWALGHLPEWAKSPAAPAPKP